MTEYRLWVVVAVIACASLIPGGVTAEQIIHLPGPIESCIDHGTCTIGADAAFINQAVSAFDYFDNDRAGYLLRYRLYPTSTLREYSGTKPIRIPAKPG